MSSGVAKVLVVDYVIYARISRDLAGTAAGVSVQEQQCRELAKERGLNVVDLYVDNDISAYSGVPRPAYAAMLKRVRDGGIDGILCWHIDRLFRRNVDLEEIVNLVAETGVRVDTVKAGDLDLNTATGRAMARVVATMANYEVDHQIERQKASHAARATAGRWRGGRAPYGYARGPEKGTLVIAPHEADVIRRTARHILDGRTILSMVRMLNNEGVPPPRGSNGKTGEKWYASPLKRIMVNPAVAGKSKHHGVIVGDAEWEPILDEATWQAVCDIVMDPARLTHASAEKKWQGTGLYLCGRCGARMGTGKSKRKTGSGRVYACKSCNRVSRQLDDVDGLVDDVVVGYLDMPNNRLNLIQRNNDADVDVAGLVEQRATLANRKDQMGAMFAAGTIDGRQLAAGTEEIRRQLDALDRKLTAARRTSPALDLVLSGEDLRTRWRELPAEVRGAVIDELMTVTIMPSPGKKFDPSYIKIEWRK